MRVIESSVEVDWIESGEQMLKRIEEYGRTAYKSEDKITDDSASEFIRMIVKRKHFSVLEHVTVSARIICDRGVTHEMVRHRIASYTQESTRYCNYSKDKFGNELTFIRPSWCGISGRDTRYDHWYNAMTNAEISYLTMIESGAKPQEARSVLPNSLKTEIVMTANLREWHHFFTLRTSKGAHPDMQVIANMLLNEFRSHIPVVFENIGDS